MIIFLRTTAVLLNPDSFQIITITTPAIGTYTERKVFAKIRDLKKQIGELENYIKSPPFIIVNGIMDIPSDFLTDWKLHLAHILKVNRINDNWILDTINPNKNDKMPYSVTIQFISHCVKEVVYNRLVTYITNNEFDNVTIRKDIT